MALSVEEELDRLKLDRDELTRKITQLEKKLEYKSAGKILQKIQRMVDAATATGLKVVNVNVSGDMHRILEFDLVDKSCYETITLEVTADD